ncbi:hypothetical protein [Actinomadura sp. 6N118]|uniref:hypothetical protein n=1 Tax=Actinomadura sp. 6N118 TaxID=3375151 RepID=UPI00378D5760
MPPPENDDEILVTPEALSQFAKVLRGIEPDLTTAHGYMNKIDVLAGNFKDATALRDLIGFGEKGRAIVYSQHLADLKLAVGRFAEELETMVKNYTTTEELNKNLADKVDELVGEIDPLLPG